MTPDRSEDSSTVHSVTHRGAEALRWFIERQASGHAYDIVVVEIGVHFPDLEDALIAMRVIRPKLDIILNYNAFKAGEFNCEFHAELVSKHRMTVAWGEDHLREVLERIVHAHAA